MGNTYKGVMNTVDTIVEHVFNKQITEIQKTIKEYNPSLKLVIDTDINTPIIQVAENTISVNTYALTISCYSAMNETLESYLRYIHQEFESILRFKLGIFINATELNSA